MSRLPANLLMLFLLTKSAVELWGRTGEGNSTMTRVGAGIGLTGIYIFLVGWVLMASTNWQAQENRANALEARVVQLEKDLEATRPQGSHYPFHTTP